MPPATATEALEPRFQPFQETRLAIVMYGGSSLAIYMNGCAQELLHLVRATAPRSRFVGESDALFVPGAKLSGTERVYRKLGQLIKGDRTRVSEISHADPIRTRFVVDIISGTSAGGINGIFLAKALATQVSIDALKKLWVDEGDIGKLINDRESVRGIPGLKAKDPPASFLNGARMYWKLLSAFDGMDWPPGSSSGEPAGRGRSPLVDQLDLYVTTTDLSGLVLPLRLSDKVIYEPRHRTVFHFLYSSTEASGGYRNDFIPTYNPFLAFAARCTSSLPFVFEPMKLADIDDAVKTFSNYSDGASDAEGWRRFYADYLAHPARAAGRDDETGPETNFFARRAFGDGGALDNKPFSYATDALIRRRADLPVDRKLLYIEPDPTTDQDGMEPAAPPDAIMNLLEQTVLLPRTENIREDIERVLARNRQLARVNTVLGELPSDLRHASSRRRAESDRRPEGPRLTRDELASKYLEDLLPEISLSFGAYQRLRVADVTDDLARLVTRLAGLAEDSDDFLAVRYLVRSWRDRHYAHHREPGKASFSTFLADLDITFHLRLLSFMQEATNELFDEARAAARFEEEGIRTRWADREELVDAVNAARQALVNSYVRLRAQGRRVRSPGPGNVILRALSVPDLAETLRTKLTERLEDTDPDRTPTLRAALVSGLLDRPETARLETANDVAGELDDEFERIAGAVRSSLGDVAWEIDQNVRQAFPFVAQKDLPKRAVGPDRAVRIYLAGFYDGFLEYDMVSYPMRFGTDLGEADEVEIFRVSPKDATALIDVNAPTGTRKKVAGAKYGHFGAFFDRLWRENDILWGRLDTAERLIEVLVPHGEDHDENVRLLRDEAFMEILWAELPEKDRKTLVGLMSAALVQLPPQDRTEETVLAFVRSQVGGPLNPKLEDVLRGLLNKEQLLDFYRDTYTLDERLDKGLALRNAARGAHVMGRVLKGVAEQGPVAFLAGPMAWVARIGRLMTTLVEAATPQRMAHLIVRHWLVLLYLLEGVLIAAGLLIGLRDAQQWGWTLLGITLAVNVLILFLSDLIRGGTVWRDGVKVLLALVVLAVIGMIVLEARHVGSDLAFVRGDLSPPPPLPLEPLPVEKASWQLLLPLAGAVAASLLMGWAGQELRRKRLVRAGIVSFEMAGTAERAREIMRAWRAAGRRAARANLWLDFLYILIYTPAMYLAVVWSAHQWRGEWTPIVWVGYALAWAQVAAGTFDALENACLLLVLSRKWTPADLLPSLARTFAWWKFLFVSLGAAYFVASLSRHLFTWPGTGKLVFLVPIAALAVVLEEVLRRRQRWRTV